MFHRGRGTPLFAAHGKSGLLRYISCSLICVLRDLSYLALSFFILVPFPRTLCLSHSYCASFYSTTISTKGSSRDSRNPPPPSTVRETNETRRNRLCYRASFSLASFSSSSSSFCPSCLVAPASMRRIRFPRGWKKSSVAVDDRHQNEKISLQIYVFWAYFISMRDSQVI